MQPCKISLYFLSVLFLGFYLGNLRHIFAIKMRDEAVAYAAPLSIQCSNFYVDRQELDKDREKLNKQMKQFSEEMEEIIKIFEKGYKREAISVGNKKYKK